MLLNDSLNNSINTEIMNEGNTIPNITIDTDDFIKSFK